ncbi:MAG: VOC family protein [Nitrososphaerota archaeon]|nr:VOC family protein [Nitrososphaerota archaeon]MDG6924052.1 VOC family protein [Nitrososphaerota archaeon]
MPNRTKRRAIKKPKGFKPIPAGFRTVTVYLVLNDARNAIEFYKKAFSAKELMRHTTLDGKIMNARIKIGDSIIMLSDEFPGSQTKSPVSLGASTITLHIYSKNVDRLWEQALSAGAIATMPLDNQFWGERYGQIVDPFGHHWSLSQQIKMSAKEMEEKQRAAMAAFANRNHLRAAETMPSGVG